MTLSNPQVDAELAKDFVCVRVNTDRHPETAGSLGVTYIPDVRLLSSGGKVLETQIGFIPPPEMLKKIASARAKAGSNPGK
ncbi:MAG: thioredoxin family protein [Planctomycetes bacterium]|nr:thioredoxin family protein [Planctomycetota bacterium]